MTFLLVPKKKCSPVIRALFSVWQNLASGSINRKIKIWDVITGDSILEIMGHDDNVAELVVLNDGRLVSGSSDKILKVWNTDSGVCLAQLSHNSTLRYADINGLAVLDNGDLVDLLMVQLFFGIQPIKFLADFSFFKSLNFN